VADANPISVAVDERLPGWSWESLVHVTDFDPVSDSDPTEPLPADVNDPQPPLQAGPDSPLPAEATGFLETSGEAVGDDGSVVPIIGGLPAVQGSAWNIGAPADERGAGLAEQLGQPENREDEG
jgi:hypothetical protein